MKNLFFVILRSLVFVIFASILSIAYIFRACYFCLCTFNLKTLKFQVSYSVENIKKHLHNYIQDTKQDYKNLKYGNGK